MRAWLTSALQSLAVVGASWGGAVWFWRSNARAPSNGELVALLIVVPLALVAAFLAGRTLLARRSAQPPAQAAAATSQEGSAPLTPPLPALSILASALRTPHGNSSGDLLAALAAQRARPDLDPELLDDNGYPVMSARADDAIDPQLMDQIDAWRRANAMLDPGFSPQQWRALSLGTAVAVELALYAAGHPHADAPDDAAAPPLLRILGHVTPDWSAAQCALAAAWLAHLAGQAGWPAARVQATVAASDAEHSPGVVLDELARQAERHEAPLVALWLAFGSTIGAGSVDDMALQGELFGTDNAQGLIPGEGAAGLLLADAAQARLFEGAAPTLQVATSARTPPQGKDARRAEPSQLGLLAARLLPDADAVASVDAVYADTGHRSAVLVELMAFAHGALPQLDPGADLHATGGACGHCGDASFLAALALSHHHAQDHATPALCIANEHPLNRTAVLVRPGAAPS